MIKSSTLCYSIIVVLRGNLVRTEGKYQEYYLSSLEFNLSFILNDIFLILQTRWWPQGQTTVLTGCLHTDFVNPGCVQKPFLSQLTTLSSRRPFVCTSSTTSVLIEKEQSELYSWIDAPEQSDLINYSTATRNKIDFFFLFFGTSRNRKWVDLQQLREFTDQHGRFNISRGNLCIVTMLAVNQRVCCQAWRHLWKQT